MLPKLRERSEPFPYDLGLPPGSHCRASRPATGHPPDERGHLLCRLPLGQLAEALLSGPRGRVDDLDKHLSRPRVEDKDRPVDRFRRQVALKRLVDRHAVHIGVVHKPDRLSATRGGGKGVSEGRIEWSDKGSWNNVADVTSYAMLPAVFVSAVLTVFPLPRQLNNHII